MSRQAFTGLGAVALACFAAAPGQALEISELVVFGDSNVDIGRAASNADPDDGEVPPPNTVGGRSSDGPILPEYVAERVGVDQLNFAFGGATSGERNIVGFGNDLLETGTLNQIDEYDARLGAGQADADALHLVFAGSNDLVLNEDLDLLDKSDQAAVDTEVAEVDSNLRTAVRRLTELGAENIVVATRTARPVLSDAPRPAAEPDEAALDDAAGRQLNVVIRALVADLDGTLSSDVRLFDDYARIRDIIAASGTNGFEDYSADPSQFCINSADCSDLINYDSAHKTSAVHSVLADGFIEAYDLEAAAPAPIPVPAAGWLLAGGIGALAVAHRGRRRR